MNPALFVIMTTADYQTGPALTDTQIQGSVDMGSNTYFITGNLTPPASTTYVCRMNANGTFLVSQSRQAGLTPIHTFLGWQIPA